MSALIADEIAPRVDRGTWNDANARGLELAQAHAWVEAAAAFEAAADIAADTSDVASHEALALVLNNLAHARLHTGQVDDAIRHAQRACSLRAALFGEDAMVVARARADLAVLLVHAGRAGEGLALIRRAVAAVEQSAGEEDVRLVPILENAARIALAAAQPSTAEPYLLRLFALLDVHEMSTERASTLLTFVARARAVTSVVEPSVETSLVETSSVENAVESAFEKDVETVVPLVELELIETVSAAPAASLDLIEMLPADETHVVPDAVHVDDIFGSTTIDLVDTEHDVDASDDMHSGDMQSGDRPSVLDAAPIGTVTSAAAPTTQSARGHNVLGFAIEYGTPVETGADSDGERIVPPPTSTRIPTPETSVPALTLHVQNEGARERRPRRPMFRWG